MSSPPDSFPTYTETRKTSRRSALIFVIMSVIVAFWMVRLIDAPDYTDAHYHFNAALRVVTRQGLTEPYLWTYIGAPEVLPESGVFPSHLYWMPLTSLIAAAGMQILGVDHAGAQLPNVILLTITAGIGYWLGARLGGSRRHAWMAGLLTLFSGFFTRYWGVIDTFAPYAAVGAACLVLLGQMGFGARVQSGKSTRWAVIFAAGVCAGLAHLTRADGVLMLIVGVAAVLLEKSEPHNTKARRHKATKIVLLTTGYLCVMGLWFARNLNEIGVLLPTGGAQAIWFQSYDDLFNYPPVNTFQTALADDTAALFTARLEALTSNLTTFVAVEGMIVLTPLMLIGLIRRRRNPFLRPFLFYVIGLHLVFTLIFPFPGYRGGLLHSSAALIPFWVTLGVIGLDDVVGWLGKRRRWNIGAARWVFSAALMVFAVGLSLWIGERGRVENAGMPSFYTDLDALLPTNARVMINDPAALYGNLGLGGVVVPNAAPDVIAELGVRYQLDYVVIEPAGLPAPMRVILENPPPFLREIGRIGDAIVYQINE